MSLVVAQEPRPRETLSDVSRCVVSLVATPNSETKRYDDKFRSAFLRMVENPQDEGLMSTHLFYDIPRDMGYTFSQLPYDVCNLLSGGHAWERRIREAVTNNANSGFWSKDQSSIRYALQNGLLDLLPEGHIHFLSYGGGDAHAFRGNEMQIMESAFKTREKDVIAFGAVDILERFAKSCALIAHATLGVSAEGIVGDFIYNGRLQLSESDGTPVVMIFGGPFENTPYIHGGISPVDATALAFAKLNEQHGLGATVIKTFDTNQNHDLVNGPYAAKGPFEAFLLSAFARATQQGIIENPQYDVFSRWRMTSTFDKARSCIKLAAESKVSDTVMIAGTPRSFSKGEQRVITLSHKWERSVHEDIAKRAGFDFKIIEEPGNPNMLMVAKSVRRPDKDLLDLIAA